MTSCEERMVRYAAPTLAGLKSASLFACPPCPALRLARELRDLNARLAPKGLRLRLLRGARGRALLYLYRPSALRRDFEQAELRGLLSLCGYGEGGWEQSLRELARRLRTGPDFPHEIGLFLGYPPEDVAGFMRHKGAGCKGCGAWKVYGDPAAALDRFERFKRCTASFQRRWREGKRIEQLAVAV